MDDKVFHRSEWQTESTRMRLVSVLIDSPRDQSLVPDAYKPRNASLKKRFKVTGFPTYFLVDSNQNVLGRFGAGRDKTVASFAKEIKEKLPTPSASTRISLAARRSRERPPNPPTTSSGGLKETLWETYRANVRRRLKSDWTPNPQRLNRTVQHDGTTMKICISSKSTRNAQKPRALYIAMHGGGGCAASTNDSQYDQMKTYWLNYIDEGGIYVAVRGVTNSWKLHWENASFPCYDRIIETCIAMYNVDSNRVYLCGYSAGGDGVYRVVPVMPDRFAAANMCAGHPNGVSVMNMQHVPMLLECGDLDSAYNRNRVTVQYGEKLEAMRKKYGKSCFVNETRIHVNAGHSYIRNRGDCSAPIVANNSTWVSEGTPRSCAKVTVNGNSIKWMEKHVRNPVPTHVVWQTNQCARVSPRGHDLSKLHYWIDVTDTKGKYDAGVVEASYDRRSNTITITRTGRVVRVLMDERMVSYDEPVTFRVCPQKDLGDNAGITKSLSLSPKRRTMERTLALRADPAFIFSSSALVFFSNGKWSVLED